MLTAQPTNCVLNKQGIEGFFLRAKCIKTTLCARPAVAIFQLCYFAIPLYQRRAAADEN